jgi:NADH-quinone oxidoreductase subunit H
LSQISLPWRPSPVRSSYAGRFAFRALLAAGVLAAVAAGGAVIAGAVFDSHPLAVFLLAVGPGLTAVGVGGLGVAALLAKPAYYLLGPIIRRFAGMILISAVIGSCVAVWIHALVFAYVDQTILQGAVDAGVVRATAQPLAPETWGYAPAQIATLVTARGGPMASFVDVLQYLLWPLQFWVVRDLLIVGALFGLFQVIPVYTIWWERKVAGRIQSRLGPMRVGGWHGWSQSVADGIKLVLKEDIIPADADKPLFRAAPYFAIIPSFLAFLALPFGAAYVFRELDVALIFILAMLGIEVVGVIMAGWASNNKWSVYGAMREACQMVSYEIPMGMALLVPVVTVGSLSLHQIGEAQSGGWFTWLAFQSPFTFAAFISYFIASLASCKRAPFDLPESESELVAGFHTEYSGLRWSLFFFAEYAAMFVVGGLAVILFMGAWHSPLPLAWGDDLALWLGIDKDGVLAAGMKGVLFSGPVWFVAKCVFFLYVQIWIRWTLPRIRIDQVLYACVQVLLPLTMVLLLGATLWILGEQSGGAGFALFAKIMSIVLGAVGLFFAFGMVGIAMYGFYHRRTLPGSLSTDVLPGA